VLKDWHRICLVIQSSREPQGLEINLWGLIPWLLVHGKEAVSMAGQGTAPPAFKLAWKNKDALKGDAPHIIPEMLHCWSRLPL
jgi:hypothetical protein